MNWPKNQTPIAPYPKNWKKTAVMGTLLALVCFIISIYLWHIQYDACKDDYHGKFCSMAQFLSSVTGVNRILCTAQIPGALGLVFLVGVHDLWKNRSKKDSDKPDKLH